MYCDAFFKGHVYLNIYMASNKFRLEHSGFSSDWEKWVHISAFACPSISLSHFIYFRAAHIIVNESHFMSLLLPSVIKDCCEV